MTPTKPQSCAKITHNVLQKLIKSENKNEFGIFTFSFFPIKISFVYLLFQIILVKCKLRSIETSTTYLFIRN